jgi:hypothetical protein
MLFGSESAAISSFRQACSADAWPELKYRAIAAMTLARQNDHDHPSSHDWRATRT